MSDNSTPIRSLEFGIVPGGFAVAVAVWLIAFISRLPMVLAEPPVVFALLLIVMFIAALLVGWGAGRNAKSNSSIIKQSILTLLVAGAVNVLLVGSIVGASSIASASPTENATNAITMSSLIWIPGSLLATALLGVIGGGLGCFRLRRRGNQPDPTPQSSATSQQAALALVTLITTFCLILVGAVVTSAEAGLAVPDWPNSYGWNMFLFPFSRMVGGIYYEHAHRLIGSLVGLETLVLFIWLWRRRTSITPRLKWLGTLAFILVCIQGALGGARVFVVNQWGHDVALKLAVVHGFHAQLYLLTIAALVWFLSRGGIKAPSGSPCSKVIRILASTLVITILCQTLAGALYRQLGAAAGDTESLTWAFPVHLVGAGLVFFLGMLQMILTMSNLKGNDQNVLRVMRAAFITFVIIACQLALGFGAWWVTSRYDAFDQRNSDWMIYLTASHVVVGASLLVASIFSLQEIRSYRTESSH